MGSTKHEAQHGRCQGLKKQQQKMEKVNCWYSVDRNGDQRSESIKGIGKRVKMMHQGGEAQGVGDVGRARYRRSKNNGPSEEAKTQNLAISVIQCSAFHAYKSPGELVKMQILSQFCISTQHPEDAQAYLG